MTSPIHPFPKFAPIGGLPWAVAALLLPGGMASRMVIFADADFESPPVKDAPLTVEAVAPSDNVVSIFAKKTSKNDDDNDLTIA